MKHLKWNGFAALALAGAMGLTGCAAPAAPAPSTTPTDTTTAADSATPAETGTEAEKPAESAAQDNGNGFRVIPAPNPDAAPQNLQDRKDTIIAGMTDFNGIFNPLFSDSQYDTYVNNLVFDYVLDSDKEGKVMPGVCDYTQDSPTQITLKIKEGSIFSDGQPVTAQDVINSYLITLDPNYDGNYDLLKYKVVGAQDYFENKSDTVSGIKKIDDKTIQINIEEPNSGFIFAVGTPILPSHYYKYKKGDMESLHKLDQKPMGGGPYKMTAFKEGQEVTFEANPGYRKGAPKVKNVIYRVVPNATQLQTSVAGDVDIQMIDANTDNVNAIQEAGFMDLHIFPTNGYGYVGMNSKANPAFADLKVRQAMAYALNREGAVANIYGEFGNVNDIVQSRVSPFYTDENMVKYNYDLEKSKSLLDEAGWKVGAGGIREKDGKKLTINFSGMADHVVLDVLIPEMIKAFQELGVDFKVDYVEFPTLVDRTNNEKAEMWFMAWSLTNDPDNENIFGTKKPQNRYNYSNPELDKLYKQALAEIDPDKNKALWQEVYRVINKDLPLIPVYQRSDMWAINSRIKNMDDISPYNAFSFELYKAEIAE